MNNICTEEAEGLHNLLDTKINEYIREAEILMKKSYDEAAEADESFFELHGKVLQSNIDEFDAMMDLPYKRVYKIFQACEPLYSEEHQRINDEIAKDAIKFGVSKDAVIAAYNALKQVEINDLSLFKEMSKMRAEEMGEELRKAIDRVIDITGESSEIIYEYFGTMAYVMRVWMTKRSVSDVMTDLLRKGGLT